MYILLLYIYIYVYIYIFIYLYMCFCVRFELHYIVQEGRTGNCECRARGLRMNYGLCFLTPCGRIFSGGRSSIKILALTGTRCDLVANKPILSPLQNPYSSDSSRILDRRILAEAYSRQPGTLLRPRASESAVACFLGFRRTQI